MRIDQLVPYLGYGDAISSHSLWIRDTLRKCGYQSTIYAESFDPRMIKQGQPLTKYRNEEDSKIIFHYCTSSPLSRFVRSLGKKVILIYHNITPHEYFLSVNHDIANSTRKAREELHLFSQKTELALGDSEFNRQELESVGFRNTGVLPIALDPRQMNSQPDSKVLKTFDDNYTNFLFVGRIAPNKKQEDVLKAFAYYSQAINPNSRLFLAGSSTGTEVYLDWLKWLANRLRLENVHFAGHISNSELAAYYRLANVFLCMSEHEGFCVPLLESMHFQVPIVAYACPGVAWTLGDAGILVRAKEYDIVAETLHVLVSNSELRHKIVEGQTKRLQDFAPEVVERTLKAFLLS